MSTEAVAYNRSTLLEMLHSRTVEIKFHKENGDLRILQGTLKPELLPLDVEEEVLDTWSVPNLDIVTVWDLKARDWRSIRLDRILDVN